MAILALPDDEWNTLLFIPHMILSEQTQACAPTCPEKRLMTAVLQQAFEDWAKYHALCDERSQRIATTAAQWMQADDMDWPYSCARICGVLEIDLSALRLRLFGH